MRRAIWTKDTADRIRPATLLRHDGRKLIVEDVTDSPTASRPARLALAVASPSSSWAAAPETVYVDAGELVEMTY